MTHSDVNRKRILIVEDEPIISRLCARIMGAEGFDVDVADTAEMARKTVAGRNYDMCISDIRLPGNTGIQLYEQLKTEQPQLAGRTIFITGDTLSADVQSFLHESSRPCLMKPFSPEELVAVVEEALR